MTASVEMMTAILLRCLPTAPPYSRFERREPPTRRYLCSLQAPDGRIHQTILEAANENRAAILSWHLWVEADLDIFARDPAIKMTILEVANAE